MPPIRTYPYRFLHRTAIRSLIDGKYDWLDACSFMLNILLK